MTVADLIKELSACNGEDELFIVPLSDYKISQTGFSLVVQTYNGGKLINVPNDIADI